MRAVKTHNILWDNDLFAEAANITNERLRDKLKFFDKSEVFWSIWFKFVNWIILAEPIPVAVYTENLKKKVRIFFRDYT